jgi:hypothetical protein
MIGEDLRWVAAVGGEQGERGRWRGTRHTRGELVRGGKWEGKGEECRGGRQGERVMEGKGGGRDCTKM